MVLFLFLLMSSFCKISNGVNESDRTASCQLRLLDCGEHVFSLAFGASKEQQKAHKSVKVWTRFNFDGGLILATGLQSGKIKLWNCSTGEMSAFL